MSRPHCEGTEAATSRRVRTAPLAWALLIVMSLAGSPAVAQVDDDQLGSWSMYFWRTRLDESPWGFQGDGQYRAWSMRFEWDARKDRANQEKHGISFKEAPKLWKEREPRSFGLMLRSSVVCQKFAYKNGRPLPGSDLPS